MSAKTRELFLSTVKEKSLEKFVQLVLEQVCFKFVCVATTHFWHHYSPFVYPMNVTMWPVIWKSWKGRGETIDPKLSRNSKGRFANVLIRNGMNIFVR